MLKFLCLVSACLVCTLASAESFKLADGTTVEGDIVLPAKPDALLLRSGSDKYERVPWEKLAQETLLRLKANPAFTQFVAPLIEVTDEEKIKKTEVVLQPVPRLERPEKSSVLGGLFRSPVGLLALLLIYAANIYAGYELSILRAYPVWMGCAAAAVAPVIGPVAFLFLKTRLASSEETSLVEASAASHAHAAAVHENLSAHAQVKHPSTQPRSQHADAGGATTHATQPAAASPASAAVPPPQVFKRGQFTFNRRFIETKFAGFFGIARGAADKEMILAIKTSGASHIARRISRIASNDMYVETDSGEIQIAFGEIQEITLKHQNS